MSNNISNNNVDNKQNIGINQDSIVKTAQSLVKILLQDNQLRTILKQRHNEFETLLTQGHTVYNILGVEFKADIFSEASFCILTANFRADKSVLMQKELVENNYFGFDVVKINNMLWKQGHRFAKQRAERIVKLQELAKFLRQVQKQVQVLNQDFDAALNKLSKNWHHKETVEKIFINLDQARKLRNKVQKAVNGYGLKEASHFLRNIGLKNIAIIDRHIYRFLVENKLIKAQKSITKSVYLEAEKVVVELALQVQKILQDMSRTQITEQDLIITPALLDLVLFYIQTGQVVK